MEQIINGRRYNTETATSLANNEFADGNNLLPGGRGTSLYKTKKGNFFAHYQTLWQGEHDSIEPLSMPEAKMLYEALTDHKQTWEEAFGDSPEEA